ncbi:medium chain dehydrogenase/reductase family protein [Fibrella aquatilis]|uniref:Zinc-binding dehydrogenase n=1 Tax=Fibrella aquatilis TaxID=2817059 RepID=A0A939G5Y0_9BACT|nr:medium chain dehydrogenase/reductase family protein [Fibrella aquatilis]MBO0930636.1 zinc-binding dehydrogenase [Fibrella aquatilis]
MSTFSAAPSLQNTSQATFVSQQVVFPHIVEPEEFILQRHTLPHPAAGQVVVRIEASGISFAEQSMRRGRYPGQPKFPFTPGYDLVGTVAAVGPGLDASLIGQRVAALTKTGGWASYALLAASDLLPVPAGIDPADAETLVVNGITAWQMLHRTAYVQQGQTILVHGANGGVGSILTQLARHAGVRVIGTASPRHHATLRAQGVEPVDYNDVNLVQRVRELAPDGIDAAFDNVGGASVNRSFSLLKSGGTLVCYAIASAKNSTESIVPKFIALLAKLTWWTLMPNGRKVGFYNVLAGRGSKAFQSRLRDDFAQLMSLLAKGAITPKIADRFPLEQITVAMKLAESRTVYGKVILQPKHEE